MARSAKWLNLKESDQARFAKARQWECLRIPHNPMILKILQTCLPKS
ncbi:MAG: hypothetical protein JW973_01845 [Bacteroidales bacterium]|nr:hypothetical protein [Bacteroidales bacterium]